MDTVISDEEALARIAHHVNRILAERGMSRYRLSKLTGESEQAIKHIADGVHMPRASFLARIAEGLGAKVDDLLKPIPTDTKSRKKFQEVA
jgi:transcriptional regulator with XRE-family HTH domain